MYTLACKYVQNLNLQSLDANDTSSTSPTRISDDDRKGFWELIQMDLFLQLIFDKPPSITATKWKVNMPWLEPNSQPEETIKAPLFLAVSRITLILMRFFPLFDEARATSNRDLVQKTEDLCREIQEIYAQRRLGKWLLESAEDEADIWKILDANLIGYTCIIFMLRKVNAHDIDTMTTSSSIDIELTNSPIALDAARNIVETSGLLLTRYPWPTSLAALFGAYKIHLAYALLADAVFRAPESRNVATDIGMLQMLGETIIKVAGNEQEYKPLVQALQTLNTNMRQL